MSGTGSSPRVIANALRWVGRRKTIVLPVLFAVLLVAGIGIAYSLGPLGSFSTGNAITVGPNLPPATAPPRENVSVPGGYSDLYKVLVCGQSPGVFSTDRDNISDAWKCDHRKWDPVSQEYLPILAYDDPMHSGLTNYQKYELSNRYPCLSPWSWSSGGTGFPDGYLVMSGLDPCKPLDPSYSYSGDGMSLETKYKLGLNATALSTTNNGLTDVEEYVTGITLPNGTVLHLNPAKFSQCDDGISDGWKVAYGLDPTDCSLAYKDLAGSGMTTLQKYLVSAQLEHFNQTGLSPAQRMQLYKTSGLNPTKASTIGDGIADGWKLKYNLTKALFDPTFATSLEPGSGPYRLTMMQKYEGNCNPLVASTTGSTVLTDFMKITGIDPSTGQVRMIHYADPNIKAKPWHARCDVADSAGSGIPDDVKWDATVKYPWLVGMEGCPRAPCALDPMTTDTAFSGLLDSFKLNTPLLGNRHLNPLASDTDHDNMTDGQKWAYWTLRSQTANDTLLSTIAAARGRAETPEQIRPLLGPNGDLYGSGLPNVLNPDVAGKGMLNGDNLNPPPLQDPTPGGSMHPFPVTDPALVSTGGSGLSDGWERHFDVWDPVCNHWRLDPTKNTTYTVGCAEKGVLGNLDDWARNDVGNGVAYSPPRYAANASVVDPFGNGEKYLVCVKLENGLRNASVDNYRLCPNPEQYSTDGSGIADGWEWVFYNALSQPGQASRIHPVFLSASSANLVVHNWTYTIYRTGTTAAAIHPESGPAVHETPFNACPNQNVAGFADVCQVGNQTFEGFHGVFGVTLHDEFNRSLNPLVQDSDSANGLFIPDAWDLFWAHEACPTLAAQNCGKLQYFDPLSRQNETADPISKCNVECMTESTEVQFGTDPLVKDSDHGGVDDATEVFQLHTNPLDPADDNPTVSLDHSGLTVEQKLDTTEPWWTTGCGQRGTCIRVGTPNSDGDGLRDGPDCTTSDWSTIRTLMNAGIVWNENTHPDGSFASITFHGHLTPQFQFKPSPGQPNGGPDPGYDPTNWNYSGDGIPTGWKDYYHYDPQFPLTSTAPSAPQCQTTPCISVAQKYEIGMPAGWSVTQDGPWWFGGNPTVYDTTGAGLGDGVIDPLTGNHAGGMNFDYSSVGLNDFVGENPYPFFDHNMTGTVGPGTANPPGSSGYEAYVNWWIFGGGRVASRDAATFDASQGIADRFDLDPTSVTVTSIQTGAGGNVVEKGGNAILQGRVVAKIGTSAGAEATPIGAPGVIVVANYDNYSSVGYNAVPDPSRVVGIGITNATGYFTINASFTKQHSVTLGPVLVSGQSLTKAVVFGKIWNLSEPITWQTDTTQFVPGPGYDWVVWSYGVGDWESAQPGMHHLGPEFQVLCADQPAANPCGTTFHAHGFNNTFFTPWTDSNFAVGYGLGQSVVKTPSSIVFAKPTLSVKNAGTFTTVGSVLDGSGDGLVGRPVTLRWNNVTASATTGSGGGFQALFQVGNFSHPTQGTLSASTPASAKNIITGSQESQHIIVAFPTVLSGSVLNVNRTVTAGTPVSVRVRLVDSTGGAVAGANLTLAVPDLSISSDGLTNATGYASLSVVVPTSAPVGNDGVVVQFPGNDAFTASTQTLGLVKVLQVARIQIVPFQPLENAWLNITGNLTDLDDRPLQDPDPSFVANVTLDTPGFAGLATVHSDGTWGMTLPAEVFGKTGPRSFHFIFGGSGFYLAASNLTVVPVSTQTTLNVVAGTYVRGAPAIVAGTLDDALGNGVPNATVRAFLGPWNTTAKTLPSGAFAASIPVPANYPPGLAYLRVAYAGDSTHLPSDTGLMPGSILEGVRIRAYPESVPSGRVGLNATILNDTNAPLAGVTVSFTVIGPGEPSNSSLTDAVGSSVSNVDLTGVPPGIYDVLIDIAGDTTHEAAEAHNEITVLAPTTLHVTPVYNATRGESLRAAGQLVDSAGKPVRFARLEVVLGGAPLGTVFTGADGNFTSFFPIPSTLPRAPAALEVVYAGDAQHEPAHNSQIVTILGRTTIKVIVPGSLTVGQTFVGKIGLYDDTGAPVPNTDITARLSGQNQTFLLETNATGIAEFPGKVTELGSSQLDFNFPGSGDLSGSAQTTEIKVAPSIAEEGQFAAILVVLVLLAITIASVFLARFRRRQLRGLQSIFGDAQLSLLAGNEYVATILYAYSQLTSHFVRFGYVPKPDITPQEFAKAARAALPVRDEALGTLIHLFEEARYSDHTVGAAERDQAIAALAALNRDLAKAEKAGIRPGKGRPAEGGT